MKEYCEELLTHSMLLSELKELPQTDWKLVSHTYMETMKLFHVILERDISCDISHLKIDTTKSE